MAGLLDLIMQYKYIIFFYLVIAFLVSTHWKKIDRQAKIIMLYRTKFGLKFMKRFSEKFREWIILTGYISTGVGFIGMVIIVVVLIQNLITILLDSGAQSGVALVLPGVNIPGLGVLPFWHWLIAIFVIAVIHEFGHGIVAKAHGIKVHSTGLVLIGPIIGAFVEPDEKTMDKKSDIIQYSVMSAGPFANIILAIAAIFILTAVINPLQLTMLDEQGFTFQDYVDQNYPAELANLPTGEIITSINGEQTTSFQDFSEKFQCNVPGETITVTSFNEETTTSADYSLTLMENPDNPEKAFLGISGIANEFELKPEYETGSKNVIYNVVNWLSEFLKWLFILSLGIGLFNLLPLPIVDGGKMFQIFMRKWRGKNKGDRGYHKVSTLLLLVLLFSLFLPLIRKLFGVIF